MVALLFRQTEEVLKEVNDILEDLLSAESGADDRELRFAPLHGPAPFWFDQPSLRAAVRAVAAKRKTHKHGATAALDRTRIRRSAQQENTHGTWSDWHSPVCGDRPPPLPA